MVTVFWDVDGIIHIEYLEKEKKSPLKVVRAETQLAQDCSVIFYTEFRQYNGCLCKKSIVVTAQFLRN